eukprot:TRINITY_DN37_c0_g1_i1.p2 TRINITY_DN37_c0_g1~~TRINITY_DN37_c0_g1_i1.p2  ORF type:complete len:465 (-),score=79.62 TRINITY_DN37_c0_g1_i1:387-1781(-)
MSTEITSEQVLSRDVPWETYLTARLISDRDLQLIRRFDKSTDTIQASLLEEAGPAYVEAFMTVLRNVTKEEVVQYVLAVLDEMVTSFPSKAVLFHDHSVRSLNPEAPEHFTIFLRLLSRQDWYTQEKAARLLAAVLNCRPNKADLKVEPDTPTDAIPQDKLTQTIQQFVDWLVGQLRRPTNEKRSVQVTVSVLAVLLKERGVRAFFLKAGGVPLLKPILKTPPSPGQPAITQLRYESGLCVWLLSYMKEAVDAMAQCGIAEGLMDMLKNAIKEKVVRVALMAIKNLIDEDKSHEIEQQMMEQGIDKILNIRSLQSWGDEDMYEIMEAIDTKLKEDMEVLSSFERYKKEVLSGTLEWSPIHTQDSFWQTNLEKFDEKDYQILRLLIKLLESSRESTTLAVGCHDLAEYISHHANGKQIVSDLRGKEIVMGLMTHPEGEVQKQALLCVQKLMLTKDRLEFLTAIAV